MRFMLAAVAGAFLAGPVSHAMADPVLAPHSEPAETIGKAAAGDAKPYRSELVTSCGNVAPCSLNFGKKQKARTVTLVNCAAGVNGGTALLGEIRLDEPDAVMGYMAVLSRAAIGNVEYTVQEYQHKIPVPAGRRLYVLVNASAPMSALRCIVSGTIE
jgi:hypothetical protein